MNVMQMVKDYVKCYVHTDELTDVIDIQQRIEETWGFFPERHLTALAVSEMEQDYVLRRISQAGGHIVYQRA